MAKRKGIEKLVAYQSYLRKHSFINDANNEELFDLYNKATTNEERLAIRNKIVQANLPLVAKLIAYKYNYNYDINPVYDVDDVIQEANIVLINAVEDYDASRGKFSTFLYTKLEYSIYYSNGIPNAPAHFSRGTAAKYKKVKKLIDLEYDDEYICNKYEITLDNLKILRTALTSTLSYEELMEKDEIKNILQKQDALFGDMLIGVLDEREIVEHRNEVLRNALNELKPKLKKVLVLSYGLDDPEQKRSKGTISCMCNCSRTSANTRKMRALETLRKNKELLEAFLAVDTDFDVENPDKTYYLQR